MKILHIIYDDLKNPWLGGGGAYRTFEIYRRFGKKYEITVLTGNYPGSQGREIIDNITYLRLGLPLNYLVSRISFSCRVFIHLIFNKTDVVVEDYTAFSPCFSFVFSSTRTVIASLQNIHSRKSAKGKGFFKSVSAIVFDKLAFNGFRYFTGVSPHLVEITGKKARKAVINRFVGVGIDERLYSIERRPFKGEKSYILYMGRMEIYQKGLDVLLKAFAGLAGSFRLVLAGGGVDTEKIKSIAKEYGIIDRLEISGRYSREQQIVLLSHSLFVVMPSRFEGYPLVPLEAMASGNAFVGTRIPGSIEVVSDKGILVEKDEPELLKNAMLSLCSNPDLRCKYELAGREFSRTFTWEKVSGEFETLIDDCRKDYCRK
jgi:glycosyltransferase involved in cell wall biosynthesis